jgi:hypothetical protein
MKSTDQLQSFILNGKRYNLSRTQLEKAAQSQPPRRIDKYQVSVGDMLYPPKQLVELLTNEQPINFTTMDAQRILKKLGYETKIADQGRNHVDSPEDRTISEQYFEYYLLSNGYSNFEFEPSLPGTPKRPDYRLTVGSTQMLLEVKEFFVSEKDFIGGPLGGGIRGGAVALPYAPIRQKIDDAREKFSGVKNQTCCLVLYNVNKPLVSLDPEMVYGAMLGDITWSIPFNPATQEFDDSQTTKEFGRNGKCNESRNRTISAVIVLEALMLGERRFQCHINKLKRESNRYKLEWDELFAARDQARGTERDNSIFQWRVVVLENPWANNKLSRHLFSGRFDERYGDQDGKIQRLFAGEGIKEVESLEQDCPPFEPNFRDIPRSKSKESVS